MLAKVALGQADAGFVYSTDAKTVPDDVKVIKVPAWAQPKVLYAIGVVTTSSNKAAAQAFINEGAEQGAARRSSRGRLPAARQAKSERACGVLRRRCSSPLGAASRSRSSLLPVVAIFTHVPPGTLIDQLSNPVVHDALRRQR